MRFSQIQVDGKLREAVTGMIDSGHVPHAIMFHEDDSGGAFPLCIAFLQYLYCNSRSGGDSCGSCPACNRIDKLIHPDVHFIFPTVSGELSDSYMEKFRALAGFDPLFTEAGLWEALGLESKNTTIAVKESVHLLDVLSLSALEGGYRSVVIYLPEKMTSDAANRLLKMIEEPPQMTQFLLITHSPEKVLVTISSRCQRIRVAPSATVSATTSKDAPLFAEFMQALLSKNLLSCLEVADRMASLPSRESAKSLCRHAANQMRQIFLAQQPVPLAGQISAGAAEWARKLPASFPRRALAVMDRTVMLIDRNVNLKLLFNDMADRLYILL